MTTGPEPADFVPNWSLHPGTLLKQVLTQRNLRQSELAERTGLSAKHLNQIVNQSIGITGDVAVRLDRALGIPALFWTRAEADYQAFESIRKSKLALQQHITWARQFDEQTLRRNGVTSPKDDDATTVDKILKFFQVASPEVFENNWIRRRVSFRRSQAFTVAAHNTALWLRLVERSTEHIDAEPLNMRELRKVSRTLPAMTNLSIADGFLAAGAALLQAGVVLTFVREVPGTRMNAATWWLDAERPVIGITERHRRPDIFWFNLAHELGHIIKHPRRTTFLDIDCEKTNDDPAEVEADAFAVDTLFPGDARDRIARATTKQDLVLLSAQLGTGIAVVAGSFAKLTDNWKMASPLRGKITDADINKLEKITAEPKP
jgi:HTH-type transcriptional regulator/antitoxin HigA